MLLELRICRLCLLIAVYAKENSQAAKNELTASKKKYEAGGYPAETILGEPRTQDHQWHGRNLQNQSLADKFASVTDPKSGKTEKTEITRVVKNGANVDYNRRGVITKGAEIETALGLAKVTSRPGSDGVINAVLITKEKA